MKIVISCRGAAPRALTAFTALLFLLAFRQGSAQEGNPASPAMTAEELESTQVAGERGRLLYQHDRAAWVGTDEMQKLMAFRREKRVRGYLTEPVGDAIRLTFFGSAAGDQTEALYRVEIGPDLKPLGPPIALTPGEPLTAFEASAVAARQLVLEQDLALCGSNYNIVTLSTGTAALPTWTIYLMPAQTSDDLPLGGTYRFEISGSGDQVLNQRTFTKSCLSLSGNSKAVALAVTHLMDPKPTEIHVFLSLAARKPIYVRTTSNETVWAVEGEQIRLIERNSPDGTPADSAIP